MARPGSGSLPLVITMSPFPRCRRKGKNSMEGKIAKLPSPPAVCASCDVVGQRAPPDCVQSFLQLDSIQRTDRQAGEYLDSSVELAECRAKCRPPLIVRPPHGRGVGYSPVRRHRLTRPHRADFFCGGITNRENKVHLRSARPGECVPALAAQTGGAHLHVAEQLEGERMNFAFREAACAVADKLTAPPVIEQALRDDAAGGV